MARYLNHFEFVRLSLFLVMLISLNQTNSVTSSNDTTRTRSSSSQSTVKYLPGYSGALPFHLETGYIGINNMTNGGEFEMFYYFVKSESNPKEDPVVFWFPGGPRCSGLISLFFETGPLSIDITKYRGGLPYLELNPDSWTKVANIVFPDAPADTGFSYSKSSSPNLQIGDKESAKNSHEFVIKWLIEHPEFQSNPVYIGGNSYSGKIIPVIVQYLINDVETQRYPFLHLKGYVIGNPITDRPLEISARSMKENCRGKTFGFDLNNVSCSKERQQYEECISKLNVQNILDDYCGAIKYLTGQPIDSRRSLSTTETVIPIRGCMPRNHNLLNAYWANDARVQEALHIKKGTVTNWINCNYNIPYERDIDNTVEYHQRISTKPRYRALIYSGDHDFVAPHIATEAWIRSMNLSIIDDWRPWLVDDQIAGYTITYSSGMTYATGAGHIPPMYHPKETYAMFERWISKNSL
ncbi:hypothetical protein MKW94_013166 [Papaver nudicaule]|uniref:Uncharacterized protein n=1 Tax=Papaver nudicaule TaxID=74823 RepID=A0AA41RQG7_PAPNU|nr:hypothetical protein [Papaver nudicaule]